MKHAWSRFLVRWLVSSLGLWIAAALLGSDKISFNNKLSVGLLSGLILAVINTIVKPFVVFLSLPALLLTLGIFMIVINALMVLLAAWLYKPLEVTSFGAAIVAGAMIGLVKLVSECYIGGQKILSIWNYITIGSTIIMTILILVQTRGASLGAGLGGGGEVNTVRRGSDLTVFRLTIVVAVIFVASLMVGVLTAD